MSTIGTAKTLNDLKKLVNQAIKLVGKDAKWNGWDDGSIVIYGSDGTQYFIEP